MFIFFMLTLAGLIWNGPRWVALVLVACMCGLGSSSSSFFPAAMPVSTTQGSFSLKKDKILLLGCSGPERHQLQLLEQIFSSYSTLLLGKEIPFTVGKYKRVQEIS